MPDACHVCQDPLEPGAAFCTNCGTPKAEAAPVRPAGPVREPSPAIGTTAAAAAPVTARSYRPQAAVGFTPGRATAMASAPPASYPMLRLARVVCRVLAVMTLLGGVGALLFLMAAASAPGLPPFARLGTLGGILTFIFACLYAAMFWAGGDLISIALQLDAALRPRRQ